MTILTLAECLGCGCSDEERCDSGCTWLRVDYELGIGVCSQCAEEIAHFDAIAEDAAPAAPTTPRRESESLLLPGDLRFGDPFFPFPELDDYEAALDLLP